MALQDLSQRYQDLQTDMQTTVSARQKLESQKTENEAVARELSLLPDNAGIYKQTGPVLVKQERLEADTAVQGRLGFITSEIKRVEERITAMEEDAEKLKGEIIALQGSQQA